MLSTEKSSWLALIGLSLAGFLGLLDLTIVNTALPTIQVEFSASVAQLQWIMNILLLALTTSMVILGKLADLYGRRLCLYLGLGLFALSSLGAGLAWNIDLLILFRFFQGVSIAILYTVSLALIPNIFSAHNQGKAMGIMVGAGSFGLAVGPVVGGFIVSAWSWRWIFFINVPLALFCFLFCWKTLQESKSTAITEKMDWLGFIFLLISIPLFILAIVQSEVLGFLSWPVLSLLLAAIVGMVILYQIEKRAKSPIIEFSLFKNRIFLIGLIANFSLAAFYAVDFFLIPLYLHYIRGQSPDEIGLTLLPATLLVAILSPIAGRVVDKKGPKGSLVLGLGLLSISAIFQAQFLAYTSIFWVIGAYILFGVGWACILSPSLVAALSSIPKEIGGVASGTLGTLHNFGGAMGLAFGALIYTLAAQSSLLSTALAQNFQAGNWVKTAVANTDQAIHIIKTNTPLSWQAAADLFEQFFLHGYACVMWFLALLALTSLCCVIIGFRKKAQ